MISKGRISPQILFVVTHTCLCVLSDPTLSDLSSESASTKQDPLTSPNSHTSDSNNTTQVSKYVDHTVKPNKSSSLSKPDSDLSFFWVPDADEEPVSSAPNVSDLMSSCEDKSSSSKKDNHAKNYGKKSVPDRAYFPQCIIWISLAHTVSNSVLDFYQ